jgi:DNA-binding transcriptional regulator YhcF (GntR family)
MEDEPIFRTICIDEYSATPKYQQVVNAMLRGITDGKIHQGYLLPSVNDLSHELDISRDTCIRAYRELKRLGVIQSVPGKGYFIAHTQVDRRTKIFLLFNKLSTHKKIIYDAFVARLGESAAIDFFIYNNDHSLFRELIKNHQEDYSYYVIIAHFLEETQAARQIIDTIPKHKLILLDKILPDIQGPYGAVYEDFEKDIRGALEQALDRLHKYDTLKLFFPEYTYHPTEIVKGFLHFCNQYAFNYEVLSDISAEKISPGTAYISLMENDLVLLVEKILDSRLQVGRDVGVISYNETPLKKIILSGITTISTDFQLMGEEAARLILEKSAEKVAIPFHLTLRDSL